MRVTTSMLSDNYLRDMNTNLESLSKIQQQMSSGKEISKPSDDPFKIARVLQVSTDIAANVQYKSNISDTSNFLDTTDTSLAQVGNILQRVRDLLVSAGNGGYSTDEKSALKDEINQKIGELSQVLNTNYDGKYIFGGTKSSSTPTTSSTDATTGNTIISFVKSDGSTLDLSSTASADVNQYAMIKTKLSVEISQGVSIDYSVSANDVLSYKDKAGTTINLFDTSTTKGLLSRITSDLDSNNTTNLTGTDLTDLTNAVTNVLSIRAEVGAKTNRMDDALSKNEDENASLTALLSTTEDIDITKKTMEYASMQTVYNSSLQVGAKVLQKTLLDYL